MKISVVTVVYNGENSIERTINSVLNQEEADIEYIVVDGASTDSTMDIVQKYKRDISHIVSEPDRGIYDAMNKGLKLANGDIVTFLNSDDWYEVNVLKFIADAFENRDIDILCANARMIGEYGSWIRKAELNRKNIIRQLPTSHQAIFATRRWFEKIGGFNTKYIVSADYEWVTRSITGGCRIEMLPVLVVNFLLGGMSSKFAEINREEIRNIAMQYYTGTSLEKGMKRYYLFEDLLHKSRKEGNGFWDEFKAVLPANKNIFIFGAGKGGMNSYRLLEKLEYDVSGFIDNHVRNDQTEIEGKTIQLPKILKAGRDFIVISSWRYKEDIKKQLLEQGFREKYDFCTYDDIKDKIIYGE